MDRAIRQALSTDRVVDITTRGRRTGEPRRIEIWIHESGGKYYLTGRPGRRGWYANLLADPRLTVHLKRSVQADLAARARPVSDQGERTAVLRALEGLREFVTPGTEQAWIAGSPLVEVEPE